MQISQKSFWFTPKQETFSLGLTAASDPLSVLSRRYDVSCSDRNLLENFIEDEDVKRILLPKFPNSYERMQLTIKNGGTRLEGSADTKSDLAVAEVAALELSKKLFQRAGIFDQRLTEIAKV